MISSKVMAKKYLYYSLLLNLLILSFNSTEYTQEELINYWELLLHFSFESSGALTKKYFILLTQIGNKIVPLPHDRIFYSLPESPVPSTIINNPINFKFLLAGHIPPAYYDFEAKTQKYSLSANATNYLITSKISPVQPSLIHSLFLKAGSSFPKLATFLHNTIQLSTRALSPSVQFSLTFSPTNFDDEEQKLIFSDIKRERDFLLLFSWGMLFSTLNIFNSSHFLEADLLIHFCISANIPSIALQIFQKDVKIPDPIFLQGYNEFNSKPFPAMSTAYSLGLELSVFMISFFHWRQAQFINDKIIKGLSTMANHGPSQIRQASAFALSRLLRNMKDVKKSTIRPAAINNGYLALEEFELNQRWSCSQKPEEPTAIHEEQHLKNLKHFCDENGVVITEKW